MEGLLSESIMKVAMDKENFKKEYLGLWSIEPEHQKLIDELDKFRNARFIRKIKELLILSNMYRNFGQKPNKVLAKEYIISCFTQMPEDKL